MAERKKIDRFTVLAFFFILFFLVIILKLVDLQIVRGQQYNESSQNRVLKEQTVKAPRGKIVDRYGVPIAINRQAFAVQIVKTDIDTAAMNDVMLRLAGVFEKNGDSYFNSFSKYLTLQPEGFNGKTADQFKKWIEDKNLFSLKDSDKKKLASLNNYSDIFKFLREVCFKIDASYSDEQAYKIMTLRYEVIANKWYFDTGNSITLARDVKSKTIAEIEEQNFLFPGITTDIEPMRKYIDAQTASHVIGYMGAISSEQVSAMKDEGYGPNDIIGQAGIEKWAERYLRGKDGQKRVEVDTKGRLMEELDGIPAQPGSDIVLTIDMKLQKAALESLEKNIGEIRTKGGKNNFGDANAGAVVALDVNSGEILAMASYPDYNPSTFLSGSDDKEAQKLIAQWLTDNENKPLRNRAIQDIYAPGSTFKPLTGIAALEEGVITPNTIINDTGKMNIAERDFYCLEYRNGLGAHGKLNLKKALETSCNIFFHKIGYDTGIDNIGKWARHFGLGEKTGVDLDGESAGILSSKQYKKETFSKTDPVWRGADTAQSAIGQLYNKFTPLQLANYIATLANGGKRYTPHILKSVIKYDGSVANETKPEYVQVPVKKETLDAIKEGMVAVTHSIDGTAAKVFLDFPYKVAGKTGTAETGLEATHSSNALFVCYAPADDPKIAVAVVVERGVWGSNVAPIAKDVLAEYFGLNNKAAVQSGAAIPDGAVFVR